MIDKLDLSDLPTVEALLQLQRAAYEVEAELIGFADLPPLRDTIRSLRTCGETFYGFYEEGQLCGAISYDRQADEVDICRLVVHPTCFRRGIARALLENVLSKERDAAVFLVSTGQKNLPAVKLYAQYGFEPIGTTEIASGVFLSHFNRQAGRQSL